MFLSARLALDICWLCLLTAATGALIDVLMADVLLVVLALGLVKFFFLAIDFFIVSKRRKLSIIDIHSSATSLIIP